MSFRFIYKRKLCKVVNLKFMRFYILYYYSYLFIIIFNVNYCCYSLLKK